MDRRGFLGALFGGVAAAATVDPERLLWVPGQKLISIPAPRVLSAADLFERYLREAARAIAESLDARALGYGEVTVENWWKETRAKQSAVEQTRRTGISPKSLVGTMRTALESGDGAVAGLIMADRIKLSRPAERVLFFESPLPTFTERAQVVNYRGVIVRGIQDMDVRTCQLITRLDVSYL